MSYQKTSKTVLYGTLATDISNFISAVLESSTDVEVRAGYFNLCVRRGYDGKWECGQDALALQTRFLDSDPLSLVSVGSAFQDNIVFPGFLDMQPPSPPHPLETAQY